MEIKEIIELIQAVSENSLTSFELEQGETKLVLKREKKIVTVGGDAAAMPVMAQMAAQASVAQMSQAANGQLPAAADMAAFSAGIMAAAQAQGTGAAAQNGGHSVILGDVASDKVVSCPLVGTFYSSPSPDAEDFVKVGDTVKKGQVIGIVEAMKLMNEIECEFDGIVDAVLVKNEEVVEYGQPLFRIR